MARSLAYSLCLKEIFRYGDCTVTSRNFEEGEKLLKTGHIIAIGKRPAPDYLYQIYALVPKSSSLYGEPHVVEGTIEKKKLKISKFTCNPCKSGSDKCKHIMAVLLYCNRNDLDELQEISNTDIKCLWSQKKNQVEDMYKPTPVYDFCCSKPKNIIDLSGIDPQKLDELSARMRNNFIEAAPMSGLARHVRTTKERDFVDLECCKDVEINEEDLMLAKKLCKDNSLMNDLAKEFVNDLNKCCRNTYSSKILVMKNDIIEICAETLTDKSRWHMERQYRITGSRCYSLFTASKNPKTKWIEKANGYFWPKKFSNEDTKYGNKTEKAAREAYEAFTTSKVKETGLIISESNPWLAFSPDGVILDDKGVPKKLLEIKCPVAGQELEIDKLLPTLSYLDKKRGMRLRVKHPYYGQVTLGMAILGLEECDFVIYSSREKKVHIETIALNINFAKLLLTTLKKTYFDNMLHNLCVFFKEEDRQQTSGCA